MSRFSGPQAKGVRRTARELRMYQAYLRQVDCIARGRTVSGRGGCTFADPAEFLSRSAIDALKADRLDVESYRSAS